jgi:hypothetical protein
MLIVIVVVVMMMVIVVIVVGMWIGYFLIYLAAKDYFPTNNIAIGLFAAIMGQGGSWVYGAALKVNTQNFRAEDRGKVRRMRSDTLAIATHRHRHE